MDRDPVGVIATPDRRLRVFVSSTLEELAPERASVRDAIERLHLTPVLFELGARPHPPRSLYTAYLAQSDVFVGIYWQRYGWVAPDAAVSGLEEEYDLSASIPRLLYVREPAPDRDPRLAALIDRFEAEAGASYRRFSPADDLAAIVADDLAVLLSECFAPTGPAAAEGRPSGSRLPLPLTPTIGRDPDVAALVAMLRAGERLVTLTGTGGVGKSRLALVVGHEVEADFPEGVVLVPLAPVTDPRLVLPEIAERLEVRVEASTPVDVLADRLADRRLLLVVDNFEHVLPAAVDVAELLQRCPGLHVLVTSRHVLRLRGEHEVAVAPLTVPSPETRDIRETGAVRLFVERARAARPDFELTDRNSAAVAELCRRLDGLPLALELAASRLRLLDPGELLDRLSTRLDLLASSAADLPERQRTLRATLDWSFNLLTSTEQALFARLSVFAGGATLAAAEAVCTDEVVPDVMDTLASLLEKSLLVHATAPSGPPRFQMLHVVREYAWEQLAARGETDELRARHARWFLEAIDERRHPSPQDHLDFVDLEADNVRAVVARALERRDLAELAILARQLRPWAWIRDTVWETLEWLGTASDIARDSAPRSNEAAWIWLSLGHLRESASDPADAEEPLRQALDVFTANGEHTGGLEARLSLASVYANTGRVEAGIALARETLVDAEADGRTDIVEWAAGILGTFLAARGELDAARASHHRARDAARAIGSPVYEAHAEYQLAMVEVLAGDVERAWQHLAAAASLYRRAPYHEGLAYTLEIAAAACLADGRADDAARALGAAQRMHDERRVQVRPLLQPLHQRLERAVRERLGEAPGEDAGRPEMGPLDLLDALCAGRPAPS